MTRALAELSEHCPTVTHGARREGERAYGSARGETPSRTPEGHIFPNWFDWPIYEAEAGILKGFGLSLVYGLLQTPAYAGALLHGDEAAVAARLARQEILTRTDPAPPRLYCVLDEFALLRDIGGGKVMAEQLAHLLTVASTSERISIQVVPGTRHRGVNGAFIHAPRIVRHAFDPASAKVSTSRDTVGSDAIGPNNSGDDRSTRDIGQASPDRTQEAVAGNLAKSDRALVAR